MNESSISAHLLLRQTPFGEYLRGRKKPDPAPRKIGRPRKRTAEHFAAVLRGHEQMRKWFTEEKGVPPKSDRELLSAFRNHVQQECGTPMTEGQEIRFAMGLKTVLNVLGQARAFKLANPENPAFSGVDVL